MTIEEMTAQRDALLTARLRGVCTVEIDGRRATHATDAEMAATITDLERCGDLEPTAANGLAQTVCDDSSIHRASPNRHVDKGTPGHGIRRYRRRLALTRHHQVRWRLVSIQTCLGQGCA
jgi:hypothetical protein